MEDNNNQNEELVKKYRFKLERIIFIPIIISIALTVLVFFISTKLDYGVHEFISNASKPIIYIYPEKEQEIEVSLLDKELITCSYPRYEDDWKVLADTNGNLTKIDTGTKLYSLYYESDLKENYKVEKDGFCVSKNDIASFLEDKLSTLGLNYKEKEEFIVYWLPLLEEHEYVYIRFADMEEIENNMGLSIKPEPETLIRIMMTWKGLDKSIDVEEQQLEKIERKGYTVVEWGGSEIK